MVTTTTVTVRIIDAILTNWVLASVALLLLQRGSGLLAIRRSLRIGLLVAVLSGSTLVTSAVLQAGLRDGKPANNSLHGKIILIVSVARNMLFLAGNLCIP